MLLSLVEEARERLAHALLLFAELEIHRRA